MNVRIEPCKLTGTISSIASKSMAHRLLILSALCDETTEIDLRQTSEDIEATARCLTALGAAFSDSGTGLITVPTTKLRIQTSPSLDVGESGSTLRFLLPIVCALGCGARITCHGRLAQRPLSPLDEQLRSHGARIEWTDDSTLEVSGTLEPGLFLLPGNVSSQYVSGLLMAAPLMHQDIDIAVLEPVESRGYIDLTIDALRSFGVSVHQEQQVMEERRCLIYHVNANAQLASPGKVHVEGDWSNAAFWLAAGALVGGPIEVTGLNLQSHQGDRAITAALAMFGTMVTRKGSTVGSRRLALHACQIDVSDIPDLVPPLAAVACTAVGTTRLSHAGRLRLKESDRLQTVCETLNSLGGKARIEGDDLAIEGVSSLTGGVVDAARDHRIAMMAAICAASATGPSIITGADCVSKSYPSFFEDFQALGGSSSAWEG